MAQDGRFGRPKGDEEEEEGLRGGRLLHGGFQCAARGTYERAVIDDVLGMEPILHNACVCYQRQSVIRCLSAVRAVEEASTDLFALDQSAKQTALRNVHLATSHPEAQAPACRHAHQGSHGWCGRGLQAQ